MIPDTQLSAWEELAKAATKGPWKATLSDGRGTLAVLSGTTWICGELHNNFAMPLQEAVANADFIAIGPDNFLALIADLRDARAENERLRLLLTRLSNEVLGSLPLMEELARQEFGNTNYNVLIQRAEEAREALGSKK
jgi:hypothetical protein